MDLPDVMIRVVDTGPCPLYEVADEIRLSGYALTFPEGRATCIVLVLDITEIFSEWETREPTDPDRPLAGSFRCSGCRGHIQAEYGPVPSDEEQRGGDTIRNVGTVAALLRDYSIFESLSTDHIHDIVPFLRMKRFEEGDRILSRGDPGQCLYIVLSGKVEVRSDEDLPMAYLGNGEVFGEMSLLSGDPVGATVIAADPTRILYLDSRDFRRVLNRHPSLQMYFARLLAKRLAQSNRERACEFASGMTGQLSDMPPAELFQALNVNSKTGSLDLNLPDGPARVIFREGELVGARFNDMADKEAFYAILFQRDGRFIFSHDIPEEYAEAPELGNFMWLLMEGARMQDEAEAAETP